MSNPAPIWFPALFPVFFIGIWLLATTIIGTMSGWFNLQQCYPEPTEEPLLKLKRQWASMGMGVSFNGILTFTAYRSGLGLSVWRIFGPFQRSFVVPWTEIEALPSRTFFTPMVKLNLGRPANGSLKLNGRSWSRLVAAAETTPGSIMPASPSISSKSVAQGMLLEWLVVTGVAAMLFYFVTNLGGGGLSLGICIAVPALGFGIGQLIRYARQA